MRCFQFKGYSGSIEYSLDDNLLFGQVLGIQGLISYEGLTGEDLKNDFRESINTYLDDCMEDGIAPEKPFKGSFNVRIPPKLHQKAALLALEAKTSLNNFVAESIRTRVLKGV